MQKVFDHSYGIIPLSKDPKTGRYKVFLIQNRHSRYWGFPKGHAEPGEVPLEAACRELFEETHLVFVSLVHDKPLRETYRFRHQHKTIEKTVLYFIAEVKGDAKLELDEVIDGVWLSLTQAEKRLTFNEGKHLCRLLKEILKNKSST